MASIGQRAVSILPTHANTSLPNGSVFADRGSIPSEEGLVDESTVMAEARIAGGWLRCERVNSLTLIKPKKPRQEATHNMVALNCLDTGV